MHRENAGFVCEHALLRTIERESDCEATSKYWHLRHLPEHEHLRKCVERGRVGRAYIREPVQEMPMSIRTLSASLVLASVAGLASAQCGSAQKSSYSCGEKTAAHVTTASMGMMHEGADIVDTAVAAGSFNTLAAALKAADLVDALKGKGPFTVFAPTDDAFAKLPKGTLESLLKPENKAQLQAILKYHVLSGEVLAKDVKTMSAATLNGQRVDLVVKDGKVTIDKANVTKTDIKATNGVIHVIDNVILPSPKDVVQTAIDNGNFKTLAALLTTAGLVDTLKGDGPFTVFAPTDAAFAKLPKETVDSLMKPEGKELLTQILTYHVVSGSRIFSDAAAKGASVSTVNGKEIKTMSKDGKVMINDATVSTADIDAKNGVIHVIDTVLMPK
jgi:uncharacterized surface protein with fasciclin (FAS1) repeats